MIETKTYCYCDSCKKEVSGKDALVNIRVTMDIGKRFPSHSIEICNECLTDLGFDDCKNDKKYVENYSHFVNNLANIIKQLFKK